MTGQTEWNEHFKIGVDSIDHAHRKLFSIVRKLIYLSIDENNGPWACAEGIKYFKNYAIRHFTDEEAYMQLIGYEGYEMHKRLHDNMRCQTLPALEKDLTQSNYSKESIHHFLGICIGWLTAHIMIEDHDIAEKTPKRWKRNTSKEKTKALEEALEDTIKKIFHLQTEIVSEHYSGEDFGDSIIVRLIYRSKDNKHAVIFLVLEESLILRAVSAMLNMPLTRMDKLVKNAAKELSQQITEQTSVHFHPSQHYQLESNHLVTEEQFREKFDASYFDHSLLFNTGTGYFAFCIRIQQPDSPVICPSL